MMINYLKSDLLPIETDRLLLRIPDTEDSYKLLDYYQNNREHLEPWEPKRHTTFYSPEFWKKQAISMNNQFYIGEALRLSFFLKTDPEGPILAVCNFTNIMRGVFQACYLGYSAAYKSQGKGYMYEGLKAAIDFVFARFKLHRIMANYMPQNVRSGRLLERLGFKVEGYARDFLKINGKWEDHILTSIINRN